MTPTCIACGMPMPKPEQHAMGDTDKPYCLHCARPDGTMRSYDEAVIGMTAFMMNSQGLDEMSARAAVVKLLSELPAWKDR